MWRNCSYSIKIGVFTSQSCWRSHGCDGQAMADFVMGYTQQTQNVPSLKIGINCNIIRMIYMFTCDLHRGLACSSVHFAKDRLGWGGGGGVLWFIILVNSDVQHCVFLQSWWRCSKDFVWSRWGIESQSSFFFFLLASCCVSLQIGMKGEEAVPLPSYRAFLGGSGWIFL